MFVFISDIYVYVNRSKRTSHTLFSKCMHCICKSTHRKWWLILFFFFSCLPVQAPRFMLLPPSMWNDTVWSNPRVTGCTPMFLCTYWPNLPYFCYNNCLDADNLAWRWQGSVEGYVHVYLSLSPLSLSLSCSLKQKNVNILLNFTFDSCNILICIPCIKKTR